MDLGQQPLTNKFQYWRNGLIRLTLQATNFFCNALNRPLA